MNQGGALATRAVHCRQPGAELARGARLSSIRSGHGGFPSNLREFEGVLGEFEHTGVNLREIDAKNWQISFWSLKADLAITCDHTDQLR